ncbi:MAG: SIMPL domain-containing protein [Clostridiales bacterium]|nr:SIMPL domain-containing protein [Clostridiales bacterium]
MYENNERQRNINSMANNIMTVSGRASVTAIPDIAVIRLGVMTTGDNLTRVQEDNARISQMILEGLRQIGVSDIKTHQYNIDRLYEFENGTRIDRGYFVRNIFEIRTDMLNMTGAIIDTAVSLGANLVELISFEVSAIDQYYLEALNMALSNATDKAISMSNELGAMLNPLPIRIVENSNQPTPIARSFLGEGQFATPIEDGTTEIESSVIMDFTYL